ncbi:MAG TPA: hypothetical protein VGA56_02290 [Opitutaceae bacterium]
MIEISGLPFYVVALGHKALPPSNDRAHFLAPRKRQDCVAVIRHDEKEATRPDLPKMSFLRFLQNRLRQSALVFDKLASAQNTETNVKADTLLNPRRYMVMKSPKVHLASSCFASS